jgi:hypothetical protein
MEKITFDLFIEFFIQIRQNLKNCSQLARFL